MTVQTAASAKLYIGTTTSASTQSEYEADSYTEIGEISDGGSFGDNYNDVTSDNLASSRTSHQKGTADAGVWTPTVNFDSADAGQDAVKTALDDTGTDDYNFKVELGDSGQTGGSPASPTTIFFSGKVMGRTITVGSVNSIVQANLSIGINTAIIQVDAV